MSPTIAKCCVGLIVWGLALTGTLSIANWPGNWGHSVCGAWGCGPPLQALVACHASWLVVLIPVMARVRRITSFRTVRLAGAIGFSLAITCALGVVIHEYLTWYAQASEWQRPYFWHRVGFVIFTTVELPLLEIAGVSTVFLRGTTSVRSSPNTLSNRYCGFVTESVEDGATAGTESSNSMTVPEREYPDSV